MSGNKLQPISFDSYRKTTDFGEKIERFESPIICFGRKWSRKKKRLFCCPKQITVTLYWEAQNPDFSLFTVSSVWNLIKKQILTFSSKTPKLVCHSLHSLHTWIPKFETGFIELEAFQWLRTWDFFLIEPKPINEKLSWNCLHLQLGSHQTIYFISDI